MRRKYIICFLILSVISTINAQSKRQFIKVTNSVNAQKLNELVIEKQKLSNLSEKQQN